jgi:hypothetical protein
VFENYGQPNYIYFMYHGFVLENNTHNCVQIDLHLTEKEYERWDKSTSASVLEVM